MTVFLAPINAFDLNLSCICAQEVKNIAVESHQLDRADSPLAHSGHPNEKRANIKLASFLP